MISYFADLKDRTLAQLYFKLRSRPRFDAFATAIGIGSQSIEDKAFGALDAFNLDFATGDQLDILGAIVGAERASLTDTQYRRVIRATIITNRSHGTNQDIFDLVTVALVEDEATDSVQVSERYPVLLEVVVTLGRSPTQVERARVRRLLNQAKEGGVSLRLIKAQPGALAFHARGSGEATFDGPPFSSFL